MGSPREALDRFPPSLWTRRKRNPGRPASRRDLTARVTEFFANIIAHHQRRTLLAYAGLALVALIGAARLNVENSFIDYYRESTEIYRGMALIDRCVMLPEGSTGAPSHLPG